MRFELLVKTPGGQYWSQFPATANPDAVMEQYESYGYTILEMRYY